MTLMSGPSYSVYTLLATLFYPPAPLNSERSTWNSNPAQFIAASFIYANRREEAFAIESMQTFPMGHPAKTPRSSRPLNSEPSFNV